MSLLMHVGECERSCTDAGSIFLHFYCHFLHRKLELVCQQPGDWDVKIEACLYSVRTTPNASTKFCPYRLAFGREALFPTQLDTGDEHVPECDDEVLYALDEARHTVAEEAMVNILEAQARQREQFRRKHFRVR